MTYPTNLDAVEEKMVWLQQQSDWLQAAKFSAGGIVTGENLLDLDEISDLVEHQRHYQELVQELATAVLGSFLELASWPSAEQSAAPEDQVAAALQILPDEHAAAVMAAEELFEAALTSEAAKINGALESCIGIQDTLVTWHRRLAVIVSTVIAGQVDEDDFAHDDADPGEMAKAMFKDADQALRHALSLAAQGLDDNAKEAGSNILVSVCRAVAAVTELREWLHSFCAGDDHRMVDHIHVAVWSDSLHRASQAALDEALKAVESTRTGPSSEVPEHIEEAMRQVTVAESYFVLREESKLVLSTKANVDRTGEEDR